MSAYSFVHNNGDLEVEGGYDTFEEAERAASSKWDHLTSGEKEAYKGPGCFFMVIEDGIADNGDIGKIIRDFTEGEL